MDFANAHPLQIASVSLETVTVWLATPDLTYKTINVVNKFPTVWDTTVNVAALDVLLVSNYQAASAFHAPPSLIAIPITATVVALLALLLICGNFPTDFAPVP